MRGPTRELSVIEAEVKFGYFLGEHHIPLCVADHCAKLFVSMFPDSAIAMSFKCGRKKATAVVEVVAREVKQGILSRLDPNSSAFRSTKQQILPLISSVV